MITEIVIFSFFGKVQKHLGRGKKLGFPTANVQIPYDTPDGIFAGYTKVDKQMYNSLVFVGSPLTFDEIDKKAEVYILDFNDDIYGKFIEVTALKKFRDNIKFDTKEALISQIREDEEQARIYFKAKAHREELKRKRPVKMKESTLKTKHT